MIMARRNYKVYADLGLTPEFLAKQLAVLDTGAGPNFIHKDALPLGYERFLKQGPPPNIVDANRRPIAVNGVIHLCVQLGTRLVKLAFYVCERLAAPVVLGCDFCDRFVEAILPRKKLVELDDGTTVPITRKPAKRHPESPPLPADQQYGHTRKIQSPKVRVASPVTLEPNSQTWVNVVTERCGTLILQPNTSLYANSQVTCTNGVVQVDANRPFRILIANFGQYPYMMAKGQIIGTVLPHPTAIMPSRVQLAEVLGLINEDDEADLLQLERMETSNQVGGDTAAHTPSGENFGDSPQIDVDSIDICHVDPRYREKLRSLLRKYKSMWDGKLGEISITEHPIDVFPDTRPIAQNPYRAGPKARQFESAEVERMLESGIIRPSKSPWSSPVVLVPKKDGTLRFCVDYRRLNAVTRKDRYPLPRMDEYIDSLGDSTIFSTLDCNSGYWQIPVRERDIAKTAFACHSGLFEYLRMPFGLVNAPASFQRTLDIILSHVKWKTALVYLDDVIVFSRTVEDHFKHMDDVLSSLHAAGVTLKLAKCEFFTNTVKYLGHIIRPGTLSIDEIVTKSIREIALPTNQTELRSFLGLCNVYRRFVRNFTQIAAPLNELLKKGKPVQLEPFNKLEVEAFEGLKSAISNPPILALPKPGLPYSVDTDASDVQIGAALFQEHDNVRKPIGFWSRTLHAAERNYSTSEKECLAVVWGITTLRPYLQMEQFTVHTDHSSLRWLMEINDPSGRLMRWRLRLSEFDFTVVYKKGKLNTQADALSRLKSSGHTTVEVDYDLPCFLLEGNNAEHSDGDFLEELSEEFDSLLATQEYRISEELLVPIEREELLRAQLEDDFCSKIRSRLNEGERLPFSVNEEGILIRVVHAYPQIVAPLCLRSRILYMGHHALLAGHPGGRKLYYTLSRDYYWPSMAVDAYATVRVCVRCAKERIKLRLKTKKMRLFPAKSPLESVSIDILGDLIRTPRNNRFLLVITDRFSKLVRTVPLKRITAASVAKAFIQHWVFAYGSPCSVLSDNGKQFTSRFFQDVCRILRINNVFTTTYHPQTNGQVERFNRTLLSSLRHYIADHPQEWDLYTDALVYAYNTQVHSSTKCAPFELVLSRRPPAISLRAEPDIGPDVPAVQYYLRWKSWLQRILPTATAELAKAQDRYKRNYDRRIRPQKTDYAVNDYVFVRKDHTNVKESRHKLAATVTGPYRITDVDDHTVVIEDGDSRERISRDRVTAAPCAQPTTPPLGGKQVPDDRSDSAENSKNTLNDQRITALRHADFGINRAASAQEAETGTSDKPKDGAPCRKAANAEITPPGLTSALARGVTNKGIRMRTNTTATRGQPPKINKPTAAKLATTSNQVVSHKMTTRSRAKAAENRSTIRTVRKEKELTPNKEPDIRRKRVTFSNPLVDQIIPTADYESDNAVETPLTDKETIAGGTDTRLRDYNSPAEVDNAGHPETTTELGERQAPTVCGQPLNVDRSTPSSSSTVHSQEFVVERIVAHHYADDGRLRFQVRWYGYNPKDDTVEPVHHLPRSVIIRYLRSKKLAVPECIKHAQSG